MSANACNRRLLTALSVGVALALVAPSASAAPTPPGFFGVTPAASPTTRDLQLMGQAGVQTLRQPFGWAELQPNQGGPYEFAEYDRIVSEAASQGVRVTPFIFGTPAWARNCAGVPAFYCDRVTPLSSPQGRAGWTALLQALVRRYGPSGTLWTDGSDAYAPPYLPITKWQVWNEPNSPKYLRPKPTPKAYFKLLRASSRAIRAADRKAKIMLGGLYGVPPKPGIPMWRFLDRLYRIKGAKKLFDEVALHPYAANTKGIARQVRRGREIARSHHDKARIRLTEVGWGSGSGSGGLGLYKGLAGQGSSLAGAFKFATKNRKRYRLSGIDWFSWRDLPPGAGGNCILCESFGLLDMVYQPKPSFATFARFGRG